jgi:CubicO group peptidase (beta-lactamase class C family)
MKPQNRWLTKAAALASTVALTACGSLPPTWMIMQGRSAITDHQHFENAPLAKAATPSPLPAAPAALRWPNGRNDAGQDQWFTQNGTVALVVIRRGEVVYERYFNGYARESITTSFSMAKSVVASLIGVAITEGHISSIAEPVTRYLPELLENDPRFERITLAHLLRMRSGIAFDEAYGSPFSEAARFYLSKSMKAEVAKLRIAGEPNQAYKYSSGDTQLLAMALERAVGEPLARYAERKLWQPMGAEFDASWSLDSAFGNVARAFCCLNARAIDYARLGHLFLNGGRHNEQTLVPPAWVRQITAAQKDLPGADPAAQRNIERPGTERMAYYGLQWRRAPVPATPLPRGITAQTGERHTPQARPPGNDFYAQGLYGQILYIAPDHQTVVLRLGQREGGVYWPTWMGELARLNP